ncbi:MAG: phenylalanine--tRNA ligase subunit alpha [Spirochaetales bacterium]|nr:phenylalanine--tRNA ligase subunit alpha [Spirochaetales bacterium]
MNQFEELYAEFSMMLEKAATAADVAQVKADFVGKKGRVNDIMKGLKDMGPEERKTLGAASNSLKERIIAEIDRFLEDLERRQIDERLSRDWIDVTLSDAVLDKGLSSAGYHPLSLVQREVEDIFISMGFDILDGPHIEDDYHNFEALNIPANHPARDMQDTFWFADLHHLLRTHTSPIQVRGMEAHKPPFKFVGPGKVFRNEALDASHEACFHQIEGMMVGEDISVAHMIHFLKTLLSNIFKREIKVRLRPGYFPFVEPGFELDYECLLCGGKGCSVCKQVGWVEALGCGMVHPRVLEYGRIDPLVHNGFAFGLGLDRLTMMRYGIDDVRHLQDGDLRFVSQFKAY